ncbi:MAG: VTT domain-containing protein [Bacteroidia bacterium]|nr:VTT domain-containing protein [Bacteroidia bacterium]
MSELLEIILHTDDALLAIAEANHIKAYFVLFLIIFCETGLIVTPFLPGDGLLFSAGVVAAATQLNLGLMIILLVLAAILGNIVNFAVGKYFGDRLEESPNRFVQKYLVKYIVQTRGFYEKHGGKSIILGRFFPIIRTYIPFFAGVADFPWKTFLIYTFIGAATWVPIFSLVGYFAGEIPWVKDNYGVIFMLLVILPFLSLFIGIAKETLGKFFPRKKAA